MEQTALKLLGPALFVANLAIIILAIWWPGNAASFTAAGPVSATLIAVGRLAGLLAFYLVLWQMLLIGRVGWLEKVWGHDKLSHFHHFSGLAAVAVLLFHPILLTLGYSAVAKTAPLDQFISFVTSYQHVWLAVMAYVMFLLIIGLSLWLVRRRLKYETWYFVHVALYAAILFAFLHQLEVGQDFKTLWPAAYWWALLIATLANVAYFRFIRPLFRLWRYNFKVERVETAGHKVTSIIIQGQNLARLKAKAGQFIIVRFLAEGFWWQAHPFSLSALPQPDHWRITVKAVGDFTRRVSQIPVGTPVLIDGPSGRFTAERASGRPVALIAGGIGITPLRPLFEVFGRESRPVDLIYSAHTTADFALKNELNQLAGKKARVHYVASNTSGRLTPHLVRKQVPDIKNRFVYLCGPPAMMKAVRAQLIGLGLLKREILSEKFQLG